MTDPDLWDRLCAVETPGTDAAHFEAHIEAGMKLRAGHGAPLYMEYLALIYLEKIKGQKPWASQILTDFGAWLAWDQPAHFADLMRAAGLGDKAPRAVMAEADTRAAYQAEFGHAPLAQIWPRRLAGTGRRRRGVLAAVVIGVAVLWRALAHAVQVPGAGETAIWGPGAAAVLAGLVLWYFAPREAALDPPDAWAEDEAQV